MQNTKNNKKTGKKWRSSVTNKEDVQCAHYSLPATILKTLFCLKRLQFSTKGTGHHLRVNFQDQFRLNQMKMRRIKTSLKIVYLNHQPGLKVMRKHLSKRKRDHHQSKKAQVL